MKKCYLIMSYECPIALLIASQVALHYCGLVARKPTVKPVLSGHSKIDKTKVLKTNDCLMKVESICI